LAPFSLRGLANSIKVLPPSQISSTIKEGMFESKSCGNSVLIIFPLVVSLILDATTNGNPYLEAILNAFL
jgi:hypothetical protein